MQITAGVRLAGFDQSFNGGKAELCQSKSNKQAALLLDSCFSVFKYTNKCTNKRKRLGVCLDHA